MEGTVTLDCNLISPLTYYLHLFTILGRFWSPKSTLQPNFWGFSCSSGTVNGNTLLGQGLNGCGGWVWCIGASVEGISIAIWATNANGCVGTPQKKHHTSGRQEYISSHGPNIPASASVVSSPLSWLPWVPNRGSGDKQKQSFAVSIWDAFRYVAYSWRWMLVDFSMQYLDEKLMHRSVFIMYMGQFEYALHAGGVITCWDGLYMVLIFASKVHDLNPSCVPKQVEDTYYHLIA